VIALVLDSLTTTLGDGSCYLNSALADHSVVPIVYSTRGGVRQAYAHLIQSGTCQEHTMCSWPQQSGPSQSGTCQAYTMCSWPRRPDLPIAKVFLACMRQCKQPNMKCASLIKKGKGIRSLSLIVYFITAETAVPG
jgi:hypothetical protein